jgi:glycosyltransferase involved in cell wall biosynthesis
MYWTREIAEPSEEGESTSFQRLRIVHVFRSPLGGLFRHVCNLAEAQSRMGHLVGIVCDANTGGAAADAKLKELARICALGVSRVAMSRALSAADFDAYSHIRAFVANAAPGIVHGHGAKGGAYARLLPRVPGRKVLYTPHGGTLHYEWHKPAGMMFLGLEWLLKSRTDGILFESEYSAATYAKKLGKPYCASRVVFNGLEESDFQPLADEAPLYDAAFVGELRELKGVSYLIEAAGTLNATRSFRLAIAGNGPDEAKFRADVKARGLDDRIEFLGHVKARDVFAMARVVVVPSLAESFPYIVLEAIASGRPVVATDVGGVAEIFGPHRGALVRPADVSALAREIRRALANGYVVKERAAALKTRARASFSAQHMSLDVTRFYGTCGRDAKALAATASEILQGQIS